MPNPKAIGEQSEGMILARFLQLGWIVLQPFGDNQRYDLVLDRGNGFERVQVKTARLKHGTVRIQTCSSYSHRGKGKRSYRGDCELFAAWCNETGKVYLIGVSDVGEQGCWLRIDPPKNNQAANVRFAKDYVV